MASAANKRIYGLLRYHAPQPAAFGRMECSVCLTDFPCVTVQIAKGRIVWSRDLNRFVEASSV